MPLITSTGARSGLDLEGIIKATLDSQRIPKQNRLDQQEGRLQVEMSAVGEMKSVLSKLQEAAEGLSDTSLYSKMKASVSQPESGKVVTVESSETASRGTFDIGVPQLASGSRAVSADGAFADSQAVVSATGGKLSFSAGDQSFDLDVAAGATLEDIRNAINDSENNFGVTANIINTGSEAKLVFNSEVSGAGNDLVVSNDNAELDSISTVASGTTAGMTVAAEDQARDAVINVDGIEARSDTNTFTDVIQGSTITAVGESVGTETASLSIARDDGQVKKNIDGFVKAYNGAIDSLKQIGAEGSSMQGDATIRALQGQMSDLVMSSLGGGRTLFDLGFGMDNDGKLTQENPVTSVAEQLEQNPGLFESVIGGENGLAARFDTSLQTYVQSGGSLDSRRDSIRDSISRVDDSRAALQQRMEGLEETLRSKYQALDSLVGQLRDRGNYIDSQLSNLPGFSRNDD